MYYPDIYIPLGTDATVLTPSKVKHLPKLDQDELWRMKHRYERDGKKGVFALLKGKYRWLDKEDYE